MTSLARLLGADRFQELVNATRGIAWALVDAPAPYDDAAVQAVATRMRAPQTYGWSREARAVPLGLAAAAAMAAEEADRAEGIDLQAMWAAYGDGRAA